MCKSKGASAQNVSTVLRCRKGDLAILLDGKCAGYIVEVLRYRGPCTTREGEVLVDAWDVYHHTDKPGFTYVGEDKKMLPIRPGDLEETETEESVREKEKQQ